MMDSFEPRFADLVRIFTTTRGTDDFIIGAAVTGFRSFNAALEIGDRFYYCATHMDRPSEREVGRGMLRADGKIAREAVSGALVSFSPGTKTIALVAASEWYEAIKQQVVAAETVATGAADAAAASAAQIADGLSFAADSDDAVQRSFAAKLGDVVSVKDFGAVGDGIADDSAAVKAAFQYGCATGVPIFVPFGTFLIRSSVDGLFTMDMRAVGSDRFCMFGTGVGSVIKLMDGEVNSAYDVMSVFRPNANMEAIEIRDLFFDNNARGSAPPASAYDFQQSHTFQVAVPAGVMVKTVRFQNVTIRDPAADGFHNSGPGTVETYIVDNCCAYDRTRVRSDIQFSRRPLNAIITGFRGKGIESEAPSGSGSAKSIFTISNCIVDYVDIDALTSEQALQLLDVHLAGVHVKSWCYFNNLRLFADASCRLRASADAALAGRSFQNLVAGSRIGATIMLPYDAMTNTITTINPSWVGSCTSHVTWENVRFEIDSLDPAIAPAGAAFAVVPADNVTPASYKRLRHHLKNCWFDPRLQRSVTAYRNGITILENCTFGGTECALWYGLSSGRAVDVTVSGGDFSAVTGAAVKAAWLSVDQSTSIAYLRLRGEHVGVVTPVATDSGAIANGDNQLISNRRMVMAALPASGLRGDVVELAAPMDGKPDQYRCTMSSPSVPNWRTTRQAGVRRDGSANRPVLTANDSGTRYFDTSLATGGKPISWTGVNWVDATGAAV